MFLKFDTTRIYRQTAPDADEHGGGGQPAAASEEPAEESKPVDTTPEDVGQDVIPSDDEPSLWDQLNADIDADENSDVLPDADQPVPEEKAEEPTPEAPADEESQSPAESPAEEEPTAADTAVPSEPEEQPPEPEPEPEAPKVEPITPEQAAQQRQDMVDRLIGHYKLSEDDALQLVTDPAKVYPRLQAQAMTDMWYGMIEMMKQSVPEIVRQTVRDTKVQAEKVDDFFTAWPQLNQKEHGKTIAQVAKVYAQVNPNATEEEVTKYVGMQTMMLHGIIPEQYQQPPAAPVTPAQTPVPPHQPAAVNSVRTEQLSPRSNNIYEQMAEDLIDDDLNY